MAGAVQRIRGPRHHGVESSSAPAACRCLRSDGRSAAGSRRGACSRPRRREGGPPSADAPDRHGRRLQRQHHPRHVDARQRQPRGHRLRGLPGRTRVAKVGSTVYAVKRTSCTRSVYTVSAYDKAGNLSARSAPVRPKACTPPPSDALDPPERRPDAAGLDPRRRRRPTPASPTPAPATRAPRIPARPTRPRRPRRRRRRHHRADAAGQRAHDGNDDGQRLAGLGRLDRRRRRDRLHGLA